MKTTLSAKQLSAIELLVTGLQQKQVAAQIGVAEETLCRWLKDENFRQLRDTRIRESYMDIAAEARAITLALARNGEKESVRLNAAKDIQDRAGLAGVQKVETIGDTTITVSIDNEQQQDNP